LIHKLEAKVLLQNH